MQTRSLIAPASGITVRDLLGGLIVGVGIGALVDTLPIPLIPRRGLAGAATLAATFIAAWMWGRDMTRLAEGVETRVVGRWTALAFGPAIIGVGALLAAIEPTVVQRGARAGLAVHGVYTLLFVPATAFVSAVGSFALGRGLIDARFGLRLAGVAASAAATAFLAVDLVMYAFGWRVGSPNAARRATMLVVTALGALAAAAAAGAAIGALLRARGSPTSPRHPESPHLPA
jgi:hypothetical protein